MDSAYWIALGSVITAFGAFLPLKNMKRYFKKSVLKDCMFHSKFWITLGAIITLSASFKAANEQAFFDKKLSDKSEEIAKMSKEIARKSEEIAKNQSDFSKQLELKNAEIVNLNNKIISTITGGSSFCRFSMMKIPDRDFIHIVLLHEGKYPIYDVKAQVFDLDDLKKQVNYPLTNKQLIEIGNLPARSSLPGIFKVPVNGRVKIKLNFFFVDRNGYFDQELRLTLIGNEWRSASRVIDNVTGRGKNRILFQEIDPELRKNGAYNF